MMGAVSLVLGLSPPVQASMAELGAADQVIHELQGRGISESFASELRKRTEVSIDPKKILIPNVFGFAISPDYSGHVSAEAVRKCREFMRKHGAAFARAKKRFGVSKEVIAALLWVETRHGQSLGRHSVVDVYFKLAQVNHPEILGKLLDRVDADVSLDDEKRLQWREKVVSFAKRKSEWAKDQLAALDEIHSQGYTDVYRLKGSYAGAFGIPQFIPSSYLRWASDGKGSKGDLFRATDAIYSAANYLHVHGWAKDDESKRKALYAYNRSEAYVDAILTLSTRIK